jgi:uncharacterized protein (TIGR00730 family)
MTSICVFCGANFNGDPLLERAIAQLAELMSAQNIQLVYGGAKGGVMGMLADAVLNKGGKVIGVIPRLLMDREIAHPRLTQLHIVDTMHQRKQLMNDLCDGIITLPGGLGTMDEFFEVITWLQMGLHKHPVGILNVNGYYDFLLKQLDVMVEQGFLRPANRALIISSGGVIELVNLMNDFETGAKISS